MKQLTFISLAFLLFGAFQANGQKNTPTDYVNLYSAFAIEEMERSGIPASITLAQGILESGSGNSMLARKGNNHFGIKCHKSWTGERLYYDDDKKGECFRSYESALQSFKDHSEFLVGKTRYAALFELDLHDYKGWSKGLKKAGYATDPKYAYRLISLIEKYELTQYDHQNVLAKEEKVEAKPEVTETNKKLASLQINQLEAIVYSPNIDLSQMAHQNYLSINRLLKYNDLKDVSQLKMGDPIFLKPKRKSGDVRYHIVEQYESMHSISQKHGIKLKWLYKRNNMTQGAEAQMGEKLYLQGKNPSSPVIRLSAIEKRNNHLTFVKLRYHRVMSHESLTAIGRLYGYTLAEMKKLNNLESAKLKTGQIIIAGFEA